jgi:transposase
MRQQTRPSKEPAEKVVQDIRRATRKHYSAKEKIRIVLEGLRGEDSIAELCRAQRRAALEPLPHSRLRHTIPRRG